MTLRTFNILYSLPILCADSNLSPNGGLLNTNEFVSSKILNVIFDLPTLNCSKLKSSEMFTTEEIYFLSFSLKNLPKKIQTIKYSVREILSSKK